MDHLYNEKKYQLIFDNYINGNIADYKKQLNRLNKFQIVNLIGFLKPLGYTVIINYPDPVLQMINIF